MLGWTSACRSTATREIVLAAAQCLSAGAGTCALSTHGRVHGWIVGLVVGFLTGAAEAQQLAFPRFRGAGDDPRTAIAQPETTSQASGGYVSSVEPYLGPLGDPLGIRPVLKAQGVEYSLTYIADVLGNPVGGIRQGAIAEDRLNLRLNLDLQKI